jgi:hypothetical protein
MGTDPPGRMIRTGRTGRRRGGISSRAGTRASFCGVSRADGDPLGSLLGWEPRRRSPRSFTAWCRPDREPAMKLALRHGLSA